MNRHDAADEVRNLLPPAAAEAVICSWNDWRGCTLYIPSVPLTTYRGYQRAAQGTVRFMASTEDVLRAKAVPTNQIARFWAILGGERITF